MEDEYKYSFYWVTNDLEEIPVGTFSRYIDLPWKMRQAASMYWGDRWEQVNQVECLVPLYIRNIDTREALIAK